MERKREDGVMEGEECKERGDEGIRKDKMKEEKEL